MLKNVFQQISLPELESQAYECTEFDALPDTSLTEIPNDQAEVSGNLPSIVKELEGRLRLLIKTSMVKLSGLYGEATEQNFPTRNSYRNPIVAEALKSLGFVNRFGHGVQRAQALLADNGNPPAVFEFDAHSVLVKIYKRTE